MSCGHRPQTPPTPPIRLRALYSISWSPDRSNFSKSAWGEGGGGSMPLCRWALVLGPCPFELKNLFVVALFAIMPRSPCITSSQVAGIFIKKYLPNRCGACAWFCVICSCCTKASASSDFRIVPLPARRNLQRRLWSTQLQAGGMRKWAEL